ncbi:response regulator transcription factor [Azorhizobium oxalatiphilum]|uniref:response regulator transcription factor n=1 Tax=Azorhizobium oxalatiphilum TaxID=980631 RepID=UPI001FCEC642|nr:response regulator [Azorhizobium oxalatiphilum]
MAIVDDDQAVLDATSEFLESLGYSAVAFSSGEDFLSFSGQAAISHLLTDVNMPGMSGLELQDIVRQRYPNMTVIMMTALRDEVVRRRALAGGAKELLRKPIIADDLIRCLEDAAT